MRPSGLDVLSRLQQWIDNTISVVSVDLSFHYLRQSWKESRRILAAVGAWVLTGTSHLKNEKYFFQSLNPTDQPVQHWHLGYLAGQMTSSQWVQNG